MYGNYQCMRWTVATGVELSVSHWEDKPGIVTYSVALLRSGRVAHDTVAYFSSEDEESTIYRALDYAGGLVIREIGVLPDRFYWDHVTYASNAARTFALPL